MTRASKLRASDQYHTAMCQNKIQQKLAKSLTMIKNIYRSKTLLLANVKFFQNIFFWPDPICYSPAFQKRNMDIPEGK